jgi:hypothetical protein
MSDISNAHLNEFCEKLKVFRDTTLKQPSQRALLDAILRFAWNASAKEKALEKGFDGCFKPDQAELIMAYDPGVWPPAPGGPIAAAAGGSVTMIPRMIRASMIQSIP